MIDPSVYGHEKTADFEIVVANLTAVLRQVLLSALGSEIKLN